MRKIGEALDLDSLDTLWIIDTNGLCLIQQVFNPQNELVDRKMFSNFISALLNFTDKIFSDQIENLSMGKLDIHFRPFCKKQVIVAIASNRKNADISFIQNKILEVGEAFELEYSDYVCQQALCTDDYLPFSDTLDKIFGTKTLRIIPEHYEFLSLLEAAESNNYNEFLMIESILSFFEELSESKRKLLLQSTLGIITMFTESPNLSEEHLKRFQKIFS